MLLVSRFFFVMNKELKGQIECGGKLYLNRKKQKRYWLRNMNEIAAGVVGEPRKGRGLQSELKIELEKVQ